MRNQLRAMRMAAGMPDHEVSPMPAVQGRRIASGTIDRRLGNNTKRVKK